jgi:hypothetical protein
MILDILQKSKENKSLIGFNYYGSNDSFYCGYVVDYNETIVVIQHFTKFGFSDGILVHKLDGIKYYETQSLYLNGIQLLIEKQIVISNQSYKLDLTNGYLESYTTLFESFIGNKDHIIKFEMDDAELYFGFIEWCDDDCFVVRKIDSDGFINGRSTFKFEDLKMYWIDDLECRKRKILYTKVNSE